MDDLLLGHRTESSDEKEELDVEDCAKMATINSFYPSSSAPLQCDCHSTQEEVESISPESGMPVLPD